MPSLPSDNAPRALAFAVCVLAFALTPLGARADDGVDSALSIRRQASPMSLGNSVDPLTLSGFDPGDPRIGLTLIAAYGPSPFLLIEGMGDMDLRTRSFTVIELVAGTLGSLASAWSLADSLGREGDRNVAIGSLASAHALTWNLELMSSAVMRMVFGDELEGPLNELPPAFMVFPVDGGAGVSMRGTS